MTPAPREGAASTKALNDYMSLGPAPHTRACASMRSEPCDCGGVNLLHQARAELSNVEARLSALLSEADAARAALEDAIRTWTFDDGQRHTHSWHDREDWFERHEAARKIRKALAATCANTETPR